MKYVCAQYLLFLNSWNLVSFPFQFEDFGFCSFGEKERTARKILSLSLFYSSSLEYESLLTISGELILRSSGPPVFPPTSKSPPSISLVFDLGLPMFLNSAVVIPLQYFLLLYKHCLIHFIECSTYIFYFYFLWVYAHSLNIWRSFGASSVMSAETSRRGNTSSACMWNIIRFDCAWNDKI